MVKSSQLLRNDKEFIEKVKVLLLVYINMGITRIKTDNHKYAKIVFDHAWKMAKKFLYKESPSGDKLFKKSSSKANDRNSNRSGLSDYHKRNKGVSDSINQISNLHNSYIEDQEAENEIDDDYLKIVQIISKYLLKVETELSNKSQPKSQNYSFEKRSYHKQKSKDSNMSYSVIEKSNQALRKADNESKVIQKSRNRKIFVDSKKHTQRAKDAHNQSVMSPQLDKIETDKIIKEAVEKAKIETQAQYEARLKEIKDEMIKNQQAYDAFQRKQQMLDKQMQKEREELKNECKVLQTKIELQNKTKEKYDKEQSMVIKKLETNNTEEIKQMKSALTSVQETSKKIAEERESLIREKTEFMKIKQDIIKEKEAMMNKIQEAEHKMKEDARKQEELRKAEDAKRQEEARKFEQTRKLEEAKRQEEARKLEEARRIEEAQRQEELKKIEQAKILQEQRNAMQVPDQTNQLSSSKSSSEKKNEGFSGKILEEERKMKQQIKYNNGSSNQPKYMTEEREIPMDFDGDKSPVANMDNLRDSEYAQEIVDQLLMEEIIMYNASHYLNDKIYICIPNSTLAQKKNDY